MTAKLFFLRLIFLGCFFTLSVPLFGVPMMRTSFHGEEQEMPATFFSAREREREERGAAAGRTEDRGAMADRGAGLAVADARDEQSPSFQELTEEELAEYNTSVQVAADQLMAFCIFSGQNTNTYNENNIFILRNGKVILSSRSEGNSTNNQLVRERFIEAMEGFYGKAVMENILPLEQRESQTPLTLREVNAIHIQADEMKQSEISDSHKREFIFRQVMRSLPALTNEGPNNKADIQKCIEQNKDLAHALMCYRLSQKKTAAAKATYQELGEPQKHLVNATKSAAKIASRSAALAAYGVYGGWRFGAYFIDIPIDALQAHLAQGIPFVDSCKSQINSMAFDFNALDLKTRLVAPVIGGVIGGVLCPSPIGVAFGINAAAGFAAHVKKASIHYSPSQAATEVAENINLFNRSREALANFDTEKDLLWLLLQKTVEKTENFLNGTTPMDQTEIVHRVGTEITALCIIKDAILDDPCAHALADEAAAEARKEAAAAAAGKRMDARLRNPRVVW